jgi:hypothetical protein
VVSKNKTKDKKKVDAKTIGKTDNKHTGVTNIGLLLLNEPAVKI